MDVLSNTIHVPIWYDDKRIYVGTADIPIGRWTVILTLVPIFDAWSGDKDPDQPDLVILGADFSEPVNVMEDGSTALLAGLNLYKTDRDKDGRRLTLKFHNTLPPEGRPVMARYTVSVGGYRDDEERRFDPVMVGQPDPIYP